MKQTYTTPITIAFSFSPEGILCASITGSASARIDHVDEGNDYGDL